MKGNISRDGVSVATNVDISIRKRSRGNLKEFHGSFSVVHGVVFDGDEYELELEDGTSGRIVIFGLGITGGTSAKLVRFQVTGALQ